MDECEEKVRKPGKTLIFSVLGLFFVCLIFGLSLVKNVPAIAATPPTIISYQGKLLVGSSLASSTLSMTFKLYDDPTAGSVKYNSGAVSVTPTSGLFSVELGGSDGATIDPTIFRDNAALYLQVTIGAEDLSPRKRITASPYAMNALYLDGHIATSTPTTTSYVPVSDSSGNFNLFKVTSTETYVSGTSTALDGGASFYTFDSTSILKLGSITENPGVLAILGNATDSPMVMMGTGDVLNDVYNLALDGANSPSITFNYNSLTNNGLSFGANATGAYFSSTRNDSSLIFGSNIAGESVSSTNPVYTFKTNNAVTESADKLFMRWLNGSTNEMTLSTNGLLRVPYLDVMSTSTIVGLTVSASLEVNNSFTIGGQNYVQYFIDSAGVNGTVWQSDGSGRGAWVTTSSLGIAAELPSGTAGQTLRYGTSAWSATSSLFIADSGFVGIGTTTPQFRLSLNDDGGIMAGGTHGSGVSLATTTGSQFIWYPRKSAIMAGRMEAAYDYWSDSMLGEYSTSFGFNNRTGAIGAFAAGYGHQANGSYAVALGFTNQAGAEYSVGIGSNNIILGNYGLTLGHYLRVEHTNSMVIGQGTAVTSLKTFQENQLLIGFNSTIPTILVNGGGTDNQLIVRADDNQTLNIQEWQNSSSSTLAYIDSVGGFVAPYMNIDSGTLYVSSTSNYVGVSTTVPGYTFDVAGNIGLDYRGDAVFKGTFGAGSDILSTGAGTRMLWYPKKAAFRAGYVAGTNWDDASVGNYSSAIGADNKASGTHTFAGGYSSVASGDVSFAFGEYAVASGYNSVAFGYSNIASGTYSFASGQDAVATGTASFALGNNVTAGANYAYALGNGVNNYGPSSFAWGSNYTVDANSDPSFVIGRDDLDIGFFPGAGTAANSVLFSTSTSFTNYVGDVAGNTAFILDAGGWAASNADRYVLSVRAGNTPLFSVAANGNVHALGTLTASSATVGTPGAPGDLAERVDIAIDDVVEAGDVLTVDNNSPDTYRRTSGSYDASVSGVVSTNPTIVVGNGKTDYTATMAMVGRVPVKASTENGPINRGDLLVSAGLPGYAMRYDPSKDDTKVVGVIGVALDSLQSGNGKIMALIRTGWVYNRNQSIETMKLNLETLAAVQGLNIGNKPGSLDVNNNNGTLNYTSGNLNLQGFALLNVGRIVGSNGRWMIDANGRLISKVNTSEGEKTLYAVNSYNDELIISGSDKLVSGEARILFDTPTKEIINSDETLKVNVTLTSGEARGIYVKEKSQEGFVVKEVSDGQSGATFDWVVIAKRKASPTPEPPAENTTPTASGGNSDAGIQPTTPPEENTPPANEPNPVGQDSSETTNPDPPASDSSSESTEAPPASETPSLPPTTPPVEIPPAPTPEPIPTPALVDSSSSPAPEGPPTS